MLLCCFLIGVTAGLRALTPFAAVSWAAHLGWLHLENTPLSFLGSAITVGIATIAAAGELINDKLPKTPSRKAPPSFIIRILMGALVGAAFGTVTGVMLAGAGVGALGAIVGTLGGYEARTRLVRATGGKDMPIALLEDIIAVVGAFWLVMHA